MTDSILLTVKEQLGLMPDYDPFDNQLIVLINTTLNTLNQLGIGVDGYTISGAEDTWYEFLDNKMMLEQAKIYVSIKVRLLFDPPANSAVAQSLKDTAAELEWRLNSLVDYPVHDLNGR